MNVNSAPSFQSQMLKQKIEHERTKGNVSNQVSDSFSNQKTENTDSFTSSVQEKKPKKSFFEKLFSNSIEKEKEKKPKKPLLERIANYIGSVKKSCVNAEEYSKGSIKGLVSFVKGTAITTGGLFTLKKVVDSVNFGKQEKSITKGLKFFMDETYNSINNNLFNGGIKKTLKTPIGFFTAIGALGIGALAFTKQIYSAKLRANERNAMIDHKYVNTPVTNE